MSSKTGAGANAGAGMDVEVSHGAEVSSPPAASGQMTLAAAMAAGAAMSAPNSAVKLQKEKEELRRINRAWNAKAEDEKRKVMCLQGLLVHL